MGYADLKRLWIFFLAVTMARQVSELHSLSVAHCVCVGDTAQTFHAVAEARIPAKYIHTMRH